MGLKKGGLTLGQSVSSTEIAALGFSDTDLDLGMVIWGREKWMKGGLCFHKKACMSVWSLFGSTPEKLLIPKAL